PAAPAPPAPAAPPAPPTPPAPPAVLPEGWFGFGIRCSDCSFHMDVDNGVRHSSSARFGNEPTVISVEPGSPAYAAGMRGGDRLLAVDGLALTTPAGARRFSAIRPGQTVTWTYRRGSRTSTARMTAARRPDAGAPRAASPEASGRLRYSGAVGGTSVEVRGAPVTVSRDDRTGELVIRSADVTVRVRPRR
ncbi:MAG: hypothetical protein JWM27_3592, partial [Gemmatimonadetes bacterium]|nr:hypothetical protein [Gemmatimonadota bacterium]